MIRGMLLFAVMTLIATASCSLPAKRLPIPYTSAIDRLVVSRSNDPRELTIKDPKAMEKLLAFLRAHNDDWYTPWDTYPGPRYTVSLKRGDELILAVWIGANWIGGVAGKEDYSGNRLRSMTAEELAELHEILGIPKE